MRFKAYPSTISALDDRTVIVTASTALPDRERDVIPAGAWRLDAFQRNPVVLWSHDTSGVPVAKATDVHGEGNALVATVQFPPAGLYEFADTLCAMVKTGFVRAVSVGFRALESAANALGGTTFSDCELLELSFVNVPANPDALVVERGLGGAAPRARHHVADPVALRRWLRQRAPRGDEVVLTLADDDLVEIDPAALAQAYTEVLGDALSPIVVRELTAAINRHTGRID
jgi:HK97 family phage prohead protease